MKHFRSDESGVTPKFVRCNADNSCETLVPQRFYRFVTPVTPVTPKIYCFRKTCNLHEIHVTCETFSKTQVVFGIRCNALKKAAGTYCRKGFRRYA